MYIDAIRYNNHLNGVILTANFKNLVKKISQKFARNPNGFLHTQLVAIL